MLRKSLWVVSLTVGTLMSSWAQADSLDLNLNEDTMRMTYEADMGQGAKGLRLDAGYYYNDYKKSGRSDTDLTHVGLYVTGDNWSQAGVFNIKVGGRLIYSNPTTPVADYNVMALGLGADIRFSPVHRVGLGVYGYYAPRIASWLDGEHYDEYGAKIDYQLLQNAFVYVGYRRIDVEVEKVSGRFRLDDAGHVGLMLTF